MNHSKKLQDCLKPNNILVDKKPESDREKQEIKLHFRIIEKDNDSLNEKGWQEAPDLILMPRCF